MSYKRHQKATRIIADRAFKTEEKIFQTLKQKIPPCRKGIWILLGFFIGIVGGFVVGVLGLINEALNLI